jgi:hypothetical protein
MRDEVNRWVGLAFIGHERKGKLAHRWQLELRFKDAWRSRNGFVERGYRVTCEGGRRTRGRRCGEPGKEP